MKAYGFGENSFWCISSFYTNIRSSLVDNGKASLGFPIECYCHQDDPISPYLFILCVQVLACKIREDKEIKGIQILDSKFKISQFADDTSHILEGESKSFENFLEFWENLRLHRDWNWIMKKTCNVWFGSKRNCAEKLLPHLNMCWNSPKFRIFGLWFTNHLSDMAELNMIDKFIEVKKKKSFMYERSVQSFH